MRVHAAFQTTLNVLGKGIRRHGDDGDRRRIRAVQPANRLCSLIAVSYTHLDVYKRQLPDALGCKARRGGQRVPQGNTQRPGMCAQGVHIDVYKRQLIRRMDAAGNERPLKIAGEFFVIHIQMAAFDAVSKRLLARACLLYTSRCV